MHLTLIYCVCSCGAVLCQKSHPIALKIRNHFLQNTKNQQQLETLKKYTKSSTKNKNSHHHNNNNNQKHNNHLAFIRPKTMMMIMQPPSYPVHQLQYLVGLPHPKMHLTRPRHLRSIYLRPKPNILK